jgi:hypothetical protein
MMRAVEGGPNTLWVIHHDHAEQNYELIRDFTYDTTVDQAVHARHF